MKVTRAWTTLATTTSFLSAPSPSTQWTTGGAAPLRCNHCGEVESVPHVVDCDDCRRLYCAAPACLGTHGCVSLVPRRASCRRVPLDDTILPDKSCYFCDGTGQTAVDEAVAPGLCVLIQRAARAALSFCKRQLITCSCTFRRMGRAAFQRIAQPPALAGQIGSAVQQVSTSAFVELSRVPAY